MPRTSGKTPKDSTAHLGLASRVCGIWLAADQPRNNMAAAEYKHVVLGLDLLKDISDRLEEHRAKLPLVKKDVDDAMVVVERNNSRPKGVPSKDDAHPNLDGHCLGPLSIPSASTASPPRTRARISAHSPQRPAQRAASSPWCQSGRPSPLTQAASTTSPADLAAWTCRGNTTSNPTEATVASAPATP